MSSTAPRSSAWTAALLPMLGMAAVGAGAIGMAVAYEPPPPKPLPEPVVSVPPPAVTSAAAAPVLRAQPITDEMRRRGIHECNPPDPLGLGPYAPYRHVTQGRIAIPQRGAHTPDLGFDVLVHFHGADPTRKTLVQVARGVAFVAVDKGMGSGPYADAFLMKDRWPGLKASITSALRAHTGDQRAHIRHLGLSAWSAGYGAVNQIVKQDADGVDAVILLDALHGSWRFGSAERDHDRTSSVDLGYIAPIVEYARRAQQGEKLFVLTHSRIDPKQYPGVGITADALLHELGEQRTEVREPAGLLTQVGAVDTKGLHVWSFDGRNERTHCAHISLIARALTTVVEPAWDTPAMDRDVASTPAPELGGGGSGNRGAGGARATLELVAAAGTPPVEELPPAGGPQPDSAGDAQLEPVGDSARQQPAGDSARLKSAVDRGGLTPRPLSPPEAAPKNAATSTSAEPGG